MSPLDEPIFVRNSMQFSSAGGAFVLTACPSTNKTFLMLDNTQCFKRNIVTIIMLIVLD